MNSFTEMTNTNQLLIYLKQLYNKYDVHVVGRDQLKTIEPKLKQIIIFNLNKSNEIGSHWTLLVNKGQNEIVYFDSYGLPIPKEGLEFMKKAKKMKIVKDALQTTRQVQKLKTDELCGYYCMMYLYQYVDLKKDALNAVISINRQKTLIYAKRLFNKFKRLF